MLNVYRFRGGDGSSRQNIDILGIFVLKYVCLTSSGVHKCDRSVLVLDSFYLYIVLVYLKWCIMSFLGILQGIKIEKNMFRPFLYKIKMFDPCKVQRKGYPLE